MVDLDVLKNHGCSAEKWKEILSSADANGSTPKNEKIARLRNLIRSRINEGRENNIGNYRIYQALDTAWDCSYQQVTPTMLKSLIDSNMEVGAMIDALKAWGIKPEEVLEEYQDPKNPTLTLKRVNMPAFCRIFIRLVGPYVTIRRAKMMNDRKLVPFMKVEPAISNEESRLRCEVITSRFEEMAQEYGFWEVEDQACFRFLHYGICLRFLCEEWHQEKQLVDADSPYLADDYDAPDGPMTTTAEGDAKEPKKSEKCVVMKEGLRYHMPHPTRMFYDQAWPTHTFNTDSGATYAGYWRVMRYGEIINKKAFFNLGAISIGNMAQWINSNKAFFDAVYPCSLKFPSVDTSSDGVGKLDTEKQIGDAFYTTAEEDKGIVITEYFMKFIPSEYGLGDYDYPIWARFVIANHDTIIYAAPLPYSSPVIFDGYDPVSGRTLYNSMSLEILPFQDHCSNLNSQYILSVKSNLTNMVMVDTDLVDQKEISMLRKAGQMLWTAINIIPFSGKKWAKAQNAGNQVTFPQRFPQVDVASIAQAMRTQLDIMERLLGISPQELGQAASHEQTREEVKNIATNTSTRAEFTGSSLDRSKQAWKKQCYEGLMAYGSDEMYAQIPADPKITPDTLSKLGFTYEDRIDPTKRRLGVDKKITVRLNKTAIKYESFAANRDVNDRINDVELARAMGNFMMQMLGNPLTAQAIGPDQAIAMANIIGKSAGFPRDFKLYNRGADMTPEENNQEILQQVQQFLQQGLEQLKAEMTKDIQGVVQQIVEENDKQSQDIQQVQQELVRLAKAVMGEDQQPIPMPPQDLPAQPAMMPAGMA